MSTIRLHGSTSGHYDVTVPATAGTNTIDLSNLAVKDSSGNLGIGTTSPAKPLHIEGGADYNMIMRSASNRSGLAIHHPGTGTLGSPLGSALVLASDDTFRLGTQSVYNIIMDQSGRVTMPSQPSFMVYGAWSYASSTYIWKGFATIDHNIGSHWNNATGRFTAPVAGRYMIYATAHHSTANSYHLWAFLKNGSLGGGNWVQSKDGNGGDHTTSKTQVWNLAAGDYLEVASNATYANAYLGGYVTVGAYLVG